MFTISETPLDLTALRALCHDNRAGGFCSFEGWVRNEHQGRAVKGLDYQAYVELATIEGQRILAETAVQFPVIRVVAAHRVGSLAIGELAVYVGVSAGHRDAAFAACRHIIDAIKVDVPIWKREHYLEGASGWLHPTA